MAPKYKIDATKRAVRLIKGSQYPRNEQQAFILGMQAMARILTGDTSGVSRLMGTIVRKEVNK